MRDGRLVYVSIHAFRGEGDNAAVETLQITIGFNPRLPGGRRLEAPVGVAVRGAFQSTPSGGKATLLVSSHPRPTRVSIHAFRGEGDRIGAAFRPPDAVSIHAFRGEGDR